MNIALLLIFLSGIAHSETPRHFDFNFFGKRVHVDCSNTLEDERWSVEWYPGSWTPSIVSHRSDVVWPCDTQGLSGTYGMGDVHLTINDARYISFDKNGSVVELDPDMVWPEEMFAVRVRSANGAVDEKKLNGHLLFWPSGAVKSVNCYDACTWKGKAGEERLLTKLTFDDSGKLETLTDCIVHPESPEFHNFCTNYAR